jgi:hypothetical protein
VIDAALRRAPQPDASIGLWISDSERRASRQDSCSIWIAIDSNRIPAGDGLR